MAWYNNIFGRKPEEVEEKLNPIQDFLGGQIEGSREFTRHYEKFYENLKVGF